MEKAGMRLEIEESMEFQNQLHKRLKHDPSLLATMESVTEAAMEPLTEPAMEPVTDSAMESVIEPVMDSAMEAVKDSAMESITKPPETIWKSIRDRVLRSSDLPLTSEKGYDMECIFYPYWTNSDRLLIKISQTGLDLNEMRGENQPCSYDLLFLQPPGLYNTGNACDKDDLIDDDPDEAEVDDPDKAEVDSDSDSDSELEDEDEVEDEDEGDDFLYAVKTDGDTCDGDDYSADRFGMFRRNYERSLAAHVRKVMLERRECSYVFGFD
ncbi:hypothetical protein CMV_026110 [Castanea mollissima]|uniref:Uncharacterized protein n=1 Tax=Castanea mollissima TaxID=60419 RepID=A0A8J4QMT0_9ROSI|nr:hypothetical protein CMV_026110 [Castanea mollissima]